MNRFLCPRCGCVMEARAVSPGQTEELGAFEMAVPWQPSHSVPAVQQNQVEFTEAVRRSPARPATVESDFSVPALQAIGCGVAACILSVCVTLANEWPWWVPLATFGGSTAIAWFVLLAGQRKLLWMIEEVIGRDINKDGVKGQPPVEKPSIRIQVESEGGRVIQFDDLPASEEMLIEIAKALLRRGCAFSRRELSKATNLSEDEVTALQVAMRAQGYARYRGDKPNAGTELTRKGEALLGHLL